MTWSELFIGFAAWASSTIGSYGYAGIFLVSLLGNLSIIFPIPAFAFVFAMGGVLNPWLVGIAAGLGGGLGELSGYLIGRGGREVIKKKYEKKLRRVQNWTLKHGIFPIIVLFGATPLPSDAIGILAGIIRYDIRKFLLASIIGKIILNTMVALAGAYSFLAILSVMGG